MMRDRGDLARYWASSLAIAWLLALAAYLYQHRNQSLQQIFSAPILTMLSFAIAGAMAALRSWRSRVKLKTMLHTPEGLTKSKVNRNIQTPPGLRLRTFAEFFFSRRVYQLLRTVQYSDVTRTVGLASRTR
jgi:hypothetical protein